MNIEKVHTIYLTIQSKINSDSGMSAAWPLSLSLPVPHQIAASVCGLSILKQYIVFISIYRCHKLTISSMEWSFMHYTFLII